MAPASVADTMARRCPRWSGVSRTIRTSLRRSFSMTSAARVRSEVVVHVAISARLTNGTGRDDHAACTERATGDRCCDVMWRIDDVRQLMDIRQFQVSLMSQSYLRRPAHHQVSFNIGGAQQLQQTDSVVHARGTADANDQSSVAGMRVGFSHRPARKVSCMPYPKFSQIAQKHPAGLRRMPIR